MSESEDPYQKEHKNILFGRKGDLTPWKFVDFASRKKKYAL